MATMHAGKKVKNKLSDEDIDQRTVARWFGKGQSYISERITGKRVFDAKEMLILKDKLKITTKEDFIATFFPCEQWED